MRKTRTSMRRIVVLGGGTGTSTVVTGLKQAPFDVTAIVSVADSGGSTGRLRDEFGFQPVGDLRQSLAALASDKSQEWIRRLLLYRFSKGDGLKGHNLGNLILTALQDMAGSTANALEVAENVFRLDGTVLPVTTNKVDLGIEYDDGETVIGEDSLNSNERAHKKISKIFLTPAASIYPRAAKQIAAADLVIIGPGDYFASIMAVLCVRGMKECMAKVRGKIMYIVNLMTRYNQTHGMTAEEHLRGIEQAIGRKVDYILLHRGKIDADILKAYKNEHEFPVEAGGKIDERFLVRDVVAHDAADTVAGDALHRSLLRHDPGKIVRCVQEVLQ